MKCMTDSMTNQLLYNTITVWLYIICNGIGDVKEMIAGCCLLDPFKKALTRHIDQLLSLRRNLAYRMSSGRIGMHAFIDQACINADDITLMKDLSLIGDGVNNFVVYGNTKGCRITIIIQEIRNASKAANRFLTQMIQFPGGDARPDRFLQFFMNNLKESSGFSH